MGAPASDRRRRGRRTRAIAGVALALTLLATVGYDAHAQDPVDDVSAPDTPEQELADRYAPIVMIKHQSELCDPDGEPYRPASVEIVLDNREIVLRQVGEDDPVMTGSPTAGDLFELGEGFYLDFPGGALAPGCIYERDFDKYDSDHPPTVYAHVARQDDRPGQLALQYWIYWYFNDWNNKHESDWEGIQLLFDADTVEQALEVGPSSVGYAQHEGGERADWDSSKLERRDTHPVVYASAGSHASYFGSAIYIGRSASEGFGCDDTDGPSTAIAPESIVLPDEVDDPDDPLAWLSFDGRWGERHDGAFNGPTGPASKDRWSAPIDWHDDLRADSAVVPTGDSQADTVIHAFCDVVEWGSGQLIELTTEPTRFLLTLAAVVWLVVWLVRRTVWTSTDPEPLVRRRRAGQVIRTAGVTYRKRPRALIGVGLVYLPTTVAVGGLAAIAAELPVLRWSVELAESLAQTRLLAAMFVGGLANFISYVAVNAMVAALHLRNLDGARPGNAAPGDAREAVRIAWARRRPLAVAFGRSALIVVTLALSVVGLPWAIRQLVRYQLMPQVVVLEGLDGRDALARSSELVRGRWWYTAFMVTTFNLLIAASGMVIGLLVLIVFAGLPFWLFSALVTLVYALIVPLAATAQTLLYGDAVAEHSGPRPTAYDARRSTPWATEPR